MRVSPYSLCTYFSFTAAIVGFSNLAAEESSAPLLTANRSFTSPSLQVELAAAAPGLSALDIDGLGQGKRGPNAISELEANERNYRATFSSSASKLRAEYRFKTSAPSAPASWTIEVTAQGIDLISRWSSPDMAKPFQMAFDPKRCPVTLLGVPTADGHYHLPAVLHLPNQGSVRIEPDGDKSATIDYSAQRRGYKAVGPGTIAIEFPAATSQRPKVSYHLGVCAIYPDLPGIRGDPRFDSFRRNWLDDLQFNPNNRMLANNSGSTSCAFCFFEYADIAALTPPLAKGLLAVDLIKVTLDSIIAGRHAYGQPSPGNFPVESSDTLPSLLIAAGVVAKREPNRVSHRWLEENYPAIKGWADKMLATDTTGDGLTKYKISGNSGIWSNGFPTTRPANWWDTIGFGYEDAYGNALAYRALGEMSQMAEQLGHGAEAARYAQARQKIKTAYYSTFFDPATGVLAGWKSADGQLHDYYFLWVNGIAIHYGLVSPEQGAAIMNRLMAKMAAVGFSNFHLGLPGNLITVPLRDYVHRLPDGRYGGGVREDNADGFQKYENGGATGAFAYFTLAALYDLGRRSQADAILFPLLEEYDRAGFQQRGTNGMSTDWRMWDGTPMGYEGFLTDDYHALLAVAQREAAVR